MAPSFDPLSSQVLRQSAVSAGFFYFPLIAGIFADWVCKEYKHTAQKKKELG